MQGFARMALRYAAYLARRPDQPCPCPDTFRPGSRRVFRLLRRPATAEDFIPPALLPSGDRGERARCGRFALSFFTSLSAARAQYRRLAERVDAAARYGDHIGELEIRPDDGLLQVEPSRSGHLDLHPDENCDFSSRILRYHHSEEEDHAA